MQIPSLACRPIDPPGTILLVVFLLPATILTAPLNQPDASPVLGNTETDLYKPTSSKNGRALATFLQWQDNRWEMPELVKNVASTA